MVNFTTGQAVVLKHLVVFDNESKIFAAGREDYGTKHALRLYLINTHTGDVYTRNGRTESWQSVAEAERQSISDTVYHAYRGRHIPVYRIRGQFDA